MKTVALSKVALLLSQWTVAVAFVAPPINIHKVEETSDGGLAAAMDDLPDIVKAYQKGYKSVNPLNDLELSLSSSSPSVESSVPDVPIADAATPQVNHAMHNFLQAARQHLPKMPSTTRVSDESVQKSLDSIRESVQSIQETVAEARGSLQDSVGDTTTENAPAIFANAGEDSHKATELLQTSVGSMRDSLLFVHESIQQAKGVSTGDKSLPLAEYLKSQLTTSGNRGGVDHIHNQVVTAVKSSAPAVDNLVRSSGAAVENKGLPYASVAKMSLPVTTTSSNVGVDHIQNQVASVAKSSSAAVNDLVHSSVDSIKPAATATSLASISFVQQMADFVQNSKPASNVGVQSEAIVAAKIKLSMMMSNTYMLFGLNPPDQIARSGVAVAPAANLIVAFFAVLLALGSREIGREQSQRKMEVLSKQRNLEITSLEAQMYTMRHEIADLNGKVTCIQSELVFTDRKLQRQAFKAAMERRAMASKLHGLRRRVQRMKKSIDRKQQKAERLELQVLEAKTWNVGALAVLSEVNEHIRNQLTTPKHHYHEDDPAPYFLNPLERTVTSGEPAFVPSFAFQLLQM